MALDHRLELGEVFLIGRNGFECQHLRGRFQLALAKRKLDMAFLRREGDFELVGEMLAKLLQVFTRRFCV